MWFREVQNRDEKPMTVHPVLTWRRRMQESRYLVTDLDLPASQVVGLYGRQMQIEESFRDVESVRWGSSCDTCVSPNVGGTSGRR